MLTSPVIKVQGNPINAATGSNAAQKPSITRVRIKSGRLRAAEILL
jgi:hypothetical protein